MPYMEFILKLMRMWSEDWENNITQWQNFASLQCHHKPMIAQSKYSMKKATLFYDRTETHRSRPSERVRHLVYLMNIKKILRILKNDYRILPYKRTLLINAPPTVWGSLEGLFLLKMAISLLLIDRFSIRNHRWKAGIESYFTINSATLLRTHRRVY